MLRTDEHIMRHIDWYRLLPIGGVDQGEFSETR